MYPQNTETENHTRQMKFTAVCAQGSERCLQAVRAQAVGTAFCSPSFRSSCSPPHPKKMNWAFCPVLRSLGKPLTSLQNTLVQLDLTPFLSAVPQRRSTFVCPQRPCPILTSLLCPQNGATPGNGVDHPSPDGLQGPLLGRSISAYAKTDCVLNMGSFVSRLVSCLSSKVVHGCRFFAKEIR